MPTDITIQITQAGQRLDIFCANHFPDFSRSALQKAIKEGQITVNNEAVKPKYLLKDQDELSFSLDRQSTPSVAPAPLPYIPIIHEDDNIVVINKPAGVLVHPTANSQEPTVADWFTEHCSQAVSVGEDANRPGIVHRLDRDTSGVMVLAKNQSAYRHLKKQFRKRYAKKEYLTLVFGVPNAKEGRVNQPIIRSKQNPSRRTTVPVKQASITVGKPAITEWKREKTFNRQYALLRVFPLTGRTHQIRVHLHFIGHPVVGDHLYTFKRQKSPAKVTRQLLHAEKLTIQLLSSKRKTFSAPLPEDFTDVLEQLGQNPSKPGSKQTPLSFRTPSDFRSRQK